MHRRTFDAAGKITNSHGEYLEMVRQAALEEKVALIELDQMSKIFYETLGAEKSGAAFKEGDGTHHNNYGSYILAKCVIEGLKQNKTAIAKFLIKDLPAFDPARPDAPEAFAIPASPSVNAVKPLGS